MSATDPAVTDPPVVDPPADPPPADPKDGGGKDPDDQRVPYERFKQANDKAKEANEKADKLAADMAKLQKQLDAAGDAGLPEVERLQKQLDAAEKRAEEAEAAKTKADEGVENAKRERWLVAEATKQNFVDPSDALAFVKLADVEDEKDVERAVKSLAKEKPRLVKTGDPVLPGKVLQNGQQVADPKAGQIDPAATAQTIADGLKQFATPKE